MSDRHPKWKRVEAGTVIPAGQPYRVEYDGTDATQVASEFVDRVPIRASGDFATHFVDSSWRPPLELPTEPTWGIVFRSIGGPALVDRWCVRQSGKHLDSLWAVVDADAVIDFIPLTPEQVARIEAHQ